MGYLISHDLTVKINSAYNILYIVHTIRYCVSNIVFWTFRDFFDSQYLSKSDFFNPSSAASLHMIIGRSCLWSPMSTTCSALLAIIGTIHWGSGHMPDSSIIICKKVKIPMKYHSQHTNLPRNQKEERRGITFRKHAYSNILKISPPKTESFQTRFWFFFHISAQNIDCGYSLEPHRRGGSNEYPKSMILSKNKKNNVYLFKPQFYYI